MNGFSVTLLIFLGIGEKDGWWERRENVAGDDRCWAGRGMRGEGQGTKNKVLWEGR